MQLSNIRNNALQSPGRIFVQELKKLFRSPHFIIFIIVCNSLLSAISLSFLTEQEHILLPFNAMIPEWENAGIWGDIFLSVIMFTILAANVMLAGFVVVFIGIMSEHLNTCCKAGYYMIKVTKLIQHIFLLMVLTLVTVRIIVDLNHMFQLRNTFSENALYWSSMFLTIAIAVYLIFFHLKSVIAVSIMKEAVINSVPIPTSIFTAVGYFILGWAVFIIQFFTGFNLTICLGCACSVLFGIHILQFRKTMKRIEATS